MKPLKYKRGCGCLVSFKSSLKTGLDDAKTTLWASTLCPSPQTRVTSIKSESPLRSLKDDVAVSLKLFHWRQSFSELVILKLAVKKIVLYSFGLECIVYFNIRNIRLSKNWTQIQSVSEILAKTRAIDYFFKVPTLGIGHWRRGVIFKVGIDLCPFPSQDVFAGE